MALVLFNSFVLSFVPLYLCPLKSKIYRDYSRREMLFFLFLVKELERKKIRSGFISQWVSRILKHPNIHTYARAKRADRVKCKAPL